MRKLIKQKQSICDYEEVLFEDWNKKLDDGLKQLAKLNKEESEVQKEATAFLRLFEENFDLWLLDSSKLLKNPAEIDFEVNLPDIEGLDLSDELPNKDLLKQKKNSKRRR